MVKRGCNAPIYTHPATARLLRVMLEDSARLALADAQYVNRQFHELFDDDAQSQWHGPHNPFEMKNLSLVGSAEESRTLNQVTKGVIIIAGSGMCTGGRIGHHLKHNLWRPQCHLLFSGYQASGTLGRKLIAQNYLSDLQ